ncbi:NfeD family protein [Pokkaliibacter plantistimulans]|nr:NfeD family protein [Pokkaliibacter plantistimulans]
MWSMEPWQIWVIVGLLLAVGEVLGAAFVALALGLACLLGALLASMGVEFKLQLLGVAIAAVILIPLAIGAYRRRQQSGDNRAAAMVGEQHYKVRTRVVEHNGRIGVRIDGTFYPLAAQGDEQPWQVGSEVEVLGFEGITAKARPCLP